MIDTNLYSSLLDIYYELETKLYDTNFEFLPKEKREFYKGELSMYNKIMETIDRHNKENKE